MEFDGQTYHYGVTEPAYPVPIQQLIDIMPLYKGTSSDKIIYGRPAFQGQEVVVTIEFAAVDRRLRVMLVDIRNGKPNAEVLIDEPLGESPWPMEKW